MARPRIGIFGVLMAVGGLLALRWAQKQRAAQVSIHRDLSRWEDEGGAVVATAQPTPVAPPAATPSATNGASHPNGMGEAWPFPHS